MIHFESLCLCVFHCIQANTALKFPSFGLEQHFPETQPGKCVSAWQPGCGKTEGQRAKGVLRYWTLFDCSGPRDAFFCKARAIPRSECVHLSRKHSLQWEWDLQGRKKEKVGITMYRIYNPSVISFGTESCACTLVLFISTIRERMERWLARLCFRTLTSESLSPGAERLETADKALISCTDGISRPFPGLY